MPRNDDRGSGSHNWTYSSKDAAKDHERPALAMFLGGAIMHVYALLALFSYRCPSVVELTSAPKV